MNAKDIYEEIQKLEKSDLNWSNVEKLSCLYTVYDHLNRKELPQVSNTVETVKKEIPVPIEIIPIDGKSKFMQAAGGKDAASVMKIVNELMEANEVLNPSLYEVILARIGEI